MKFVKATKYNTWLKVGIAGLPGAGKSYTALNLAKYISQKRIAVIDSEAGAASKYAHLFDFDTVDLTVDDNGKEVRHPFDPRRYTEAVKEAIACGEYDVLVIDGLTPEWDDQGGMLQMVDELQRVKGKNTRDAWAVATPLHNELMNLIIRSKIHVIATMLAKKETVVDKDSKGRSIGKKVAMEPIQRDNVPRLFDVFGIMQDKEMIIDKTRCPELDEQSFLKPGKDLADILMEWAKGDPIPDRAIVEEQSTAHTEQPDSVTSDEEAQALRIHDLGRIAKRCDEVFGETKGAMVYKNARLYAVKKLHLGDVPDGLMPKAAIEEMWNAVEGAIVKQQQKQSEPVGATSSK